MKVLTILMNKGISYSLNNTKKTVSLTLASLILASATATAAPMTGVNVFGDSLSDAGAFTYLAPSVCRPDPYFECRFSNGPVWAELMADDLGLSADTAYNGGTNYAIGGQRSDQILEGQIPLYLSTNGFTADPDALYVIWGGGNDYLQDDPVGTFSPLNAVENIVNSILGLSAAGAIDFLIPNLPVFDEWGLTFNAELANSLDKLDDDLNIIQFDIFSLFLDMTFNPDSYGFTNVTEPCFTDAGVCADPDSYLLWDSVHPTAVTHRYIADAALSMIQQVQVSQPATFVLFGLGLAGLLRVNRKKLA